MINNMQHIESKIQISIIYITHGMKLYTVSFFYDGMSENDQDRSKRVTE